MCACALFFPNLKDFSRTDPEMDPKLGSKFDKNDLRGGAKIEFRDLQMRPASTGWGGGGLSFFVSFCTFYIVHVGAGGGAKCIQNWGFF